VLAVVLHFGLMLWRSVTRKTPNPWAPIEPGRPGYDWSDARRALPGTLAVFVFLNMDVVMRYVGDPVTWIGVGFLIWYWHQTLRGVFFDRAIKRGQYDYASKVILRFHPHNPESPAVLRRQALAMLLAGRYIEAEELARRAVTGARGGSDQGFALDCLGDALLEQGRYDEAMRTYEAAAKARPGFRRCYRGMAEVVLRQGKNPGRALEVVELIVGGLGPSWNKWGMNSEIRDDYWTLKAWALAQLGRTAEVKPAIDSAMRFTDHKSKSCLGITLYRIGMAMDTMGEGKKAAEYWRQAEELDPQGRAGKLAAQARRTAHQLR
jgi:tetratricopeptide (TPR) repeat protein